MMTLIALLVVCLGAGFLFGYYLGYEHASQEQGRLRGHIRVLEYMYDNKETLEAKRR